ncbi:MAG: M56 family metallopeptidase [Arenimonas sp.]
MSADFLKLLLEATIAVSFAIVVVIAVRVPMRKLFGARVAYTLWCLVPLALIAVCIPAQQIVITTVSQAVATDTSPNLPASAMAVQAVDYSSDLFLSLWLIGIVVCAFLFARQQKKFIGSLGVLNLCYEKVFLSENNNHGPSVIGVVQPRIVLPSDFNQRYSQEEQDLVLTHEQVHLSRGDTRINLLAAFLQCVFWFNPLMHWAGGRFRFDQELSTDANVLTKFPSARKSYADAMLKTQMASIGLPVACHWQAHHPLKERILMLKKATPRKMHRVLGFGLVAALCLGGAFAAWSTQPANIIVAPAEAGLQYEMRIDTKIDHVDLSRIKLREAPGKAFAVSNGKGDRDWSYEFTVSPIDADYVQLKGKVMFGGKVISKPEMKMPIGRNASVSVDTEDRSSSIIMNIVVTEVRNGKSGPISELFGDLKENDTRDSYHFTQSGSSKPTIYSENELKTQQPKPVDVSEIAMPAKLILNDTYRKHQEDGNAAGKKIVNASVLVDAQGFMAGATFDRNFENNSADVLGQVSDLLVKQKYQAAVGKNGEPVISELTVPLYDNFQAAASH